MAPDEQIEKQPTRPRRHWKRNAALAAMAWAYLAAVVAIWIVLWQAGNRWWLELVAMFAPRWVVGLPLLLLVPLAAKFRRRLLWILGAAAVVALFPVMGLCLPWSRLIESGTSAGTLRVLTCNIHGHALEAPRLAAVLSAENPDIVVLQEWNPQFASAVFAAPAWHIVTAQDFCLASRFAIHPAMAVPAVPAVEYQVETPHGLLDVFNIHLASPHAALGATMHGVPNAASRLETNGVQREDEARRLHLILQSKNGPVLVAGDFNLPGDCEVFRDNFSNLADAFTTCGFGFGWTYYATWTTTRIDHILCSNQCDCRRCWVGPFVGSPHRPVIADISVDFLR